MPHDSAQQQAQLRQGELLEVRGERLDHLQVWDHQRERGGFVRASQVRRTTMTAAEAPELLAVVRFGHPLARRCTYALVWTQSATINREGNALALAVQPLPAWRELWVFRKRGNDWSIAVLPPASVDPQLGYIEFAGWVPGGGQMLVAREARGQGRWTRSFEMVSLDSMVATRRSADAAQLGSFRRWRDPQWKRMTVSLR